MSTVHSDTTHGITTLVNRQRDAADDPLHERDAAAIALALPVRVRIVRPCRHRLHAGFERGPPAALGSHGRRRVVVELRTNRGLAAAIPLRTVTSWATHLRPHQPPEEKVEITHRQQPSWRALSLDLDEMGSTLYASYPTRIMLSCLTCVKARRIFASVFSSHSHSCISHRPLLCVWSLRPLASSK